MSETDASGPEDARLVALPLYKRAEEAMRARIADGRWPPGARLPNEPRLAEEFGVSHGTLRKALAALEAQGLVERRPGRGTRVARTTDEAAVYAFLRLWDTGGERVIPEPLSEALAEDTATPAEVEELALAEPRVWRLTRCRGHAGRAVSLERMVLPVARFPELGAHRPLPNSLYPFYESAFRQSVVAARDDLTAEPADAEAAAALSVAEGAPLLCAARVARNLSGEPVELRRSLYLTAGIAYRVDLSK
ncbi:phosphonate metabolism transcriptional regulator PhnF [Paralimibaculum aggregatum]|uniref:Phosphonate metabolism transcriptional regulator PhnF n=1 Tax=Paralimibaculum aggregatum TaxID=3036245 RepID=A0ABQ6LDD7_9RHOB|nr:GntR family transcriptional regulator [Limibaculum sp. NKW23]GMG81378.1 phosphonate metabolism transcriptional regulator PhnF [Limibaculum sp. NKW23]